jgi:hypothetical protein
MFKLKHWWRRTYTNGPYTYQRKPIPQPGAENVAFQTLQLPFLSPINGALPNLRDFSFQSDAALIDHVTGLQVMVAYQTREILLPVR